MLFWVIDCPFCVKNKYANLIFVNPAKLKGCVIAPFNVVLAIETLQLKNLTLLSCAIIKLALIIKSQFLNCKVAFASSLIWPVLPA